MIWLIAFVAFLRPLVATAFGVGYLTPDTSLYAQGGIGLFPSPLGRLAGAAGELPLAVVGAVACALLVFLVAELAEGLGGSPFTASVAALLAPLSLWTIFAGVDAIGAVFVVSAALAYLHGAQRATFLFLLVGTLAHLALAPIALAYTAWKRPKYLLVLAVPVLLALALTPYGGIIANLANPAAFTVAAIVTLAVAALQFGPFAVRFLGAEKLRPFLLCVVVGTGVAVGVQAAGDDSMTKCRYALPLTMLGAAVIATPRKRVVA